MAGPGFDDPVEAGRWMTALQAQDHPGAVTSVALRTADRDRRAVEDAFDRGELVKSWPMRGTLHLTAAEDLGWMLALMTPRVVAGAARRRAELGLDEATLERGRELAVEALRGGGRLGRDELVGHWDRNGLAMDGSRAYHLIWYLAQTATLCFGPTGGARREQQLVLLDDWVPRPRRLERDEALGELARRYFASHGPATVRDLTRWTGLVAADVRAGLALARPHLDQVVVDGVEYLLDPATPERLAAHRDEARRTLLVPGFDELILGYADRRAVLAPEVADRIVPGGNGVFRPTVWTDARVVGTWRAVGKGAKRSVEATPFTEFGDEVAAAVPEVFARLP